MENNFIEIIQIIKQSRANALKTVNAELINLYWNVGMYINNKLKHADWGDKTVAELSAYIQHNNPELRGFNSRGLYRMIQFYESYPENHKLISDLQNSLSSKNQATVIVSSLMTQFKTIDIKDSTIAKISWTHHMTIFSRCKLSEE